jgi:predicted RNase H-like HicB family nuclease
MKVSIRIVKNDQGGFTAFCPVLPGCVSKGASKCQAKERLDEAVRGYLAAMGNFVPNTRLEEEVLAV